MCCIVYCNKIYYIFNIYKKYCFDADPEPGPDPAQNLDADPDPDPDPDRGGGGRSAKNVHPPWQNPRYAPGQHHLICLQSIE